MRESLARLAETLHAVPDGETGERGDYVLHLGERLEAHAVTRLLLDERKDLADEANAAG